jgi:hypothetical protein
MPVSDWIERLGRTIFEKPFDSSQPAGDEPEMAEIRLAILDEVHGHVHRVGSRDVFPYNEVRVRLAGVPEHHAAQLNTEFFSQFCDEQVRTGLARAKCRFPADLKVHVETSPELPGPKGKWLWLEVEKQVRAEPGATAKRPARLSVIKGTANEREIALSKTRTNIGRTSDVYRTDGPVRRNDLAFDEDSPVNRSVSREHAHIIYQKKTGEYRLFNDRWYTPSSKTDSNCGLWVMRDGLTQEVHRTTKGFRLQPGDEIHLGRAVVRFVSR